MIAGLLLDLDGTLLDIDLPSFLRAYFVALEEASREIRTGDGDTTSVLQAIRAATDAMMQPHPGRTNREAFAEVFEDLTGLTYDEVWPVYERFYAQVFPRFGRLARPAAGAREVIDTASRLGLAVVIATNPIFPEAAVRHRLAWAGLDGLDVPVTSYENMTACKPQREYFLEACSLIGRDPQDCLMVGDDRFLDLAAAEVGLRTYYVGDDPDAVSDWRAPLEQLPALLEALTRDVDG